MHLTFSPFHTTIARPDPPHIYTALEPVLHSHTFNMTHRYYVAPLLIAF